MPIPDPLLTKQFNIPNACERCHADKGTDWNLKYVEQWYGDKTNRPYRQRRTIPGQESERIGESDPGRGVEAPDLATTEALTALPLGASIAF